MRTSREKTVFEEPCYLARIRELFKEVSGVGKLDLTARLDKPSAEVDCFTGVVESKGLEMRTLTCVIEAFAMREQLAKEGAAKEHLSAKSELNV